jgi:hypothetical protein
MVGVPNVLSTKEDVLNAYNYATSTGDGKAALRARLLSLKGNTTMLVLKKSAEGKDSEEQTPEDFHAVADPGCEKIRLGLTDTEIDELIGGLK